MSQSSAQPTNQPQPPRDAQAFARLLIDRFGERAASHATHQSLKAQSRGDPREAARWRWIAEFTREMLRTDFGGASGRLR
jgi:hypothetical protein